METNEIQVMMTTYQKSQLLAQISSVSVSQWEETGLPRKYLPVQSANHKPSHMLMPGIELRPQ